MCNEWFYTTTELVLRRNKVSKFARKGVTIRIKCSEKSRKEKRERSLRLAGRNSCIEMKSIQHIIRTSTGRQNKAMRSKYSKHRDGESTE